jgi:peptidyl-dipeptidase A
MDASAILEYFAPLQTWLKEQNEGKTCGWQSTTAAAPAPAAKPADPGTKPAAPAKS